MLETSARLLRLLSLLQARRDWTGADLADRLGVSARTVRRDVERLRDLGYPVHGTRGTDGGYRLGAGAAMPPLLLDDEEAVAVAVGLRAAAGGAILGIEETSVRALTKLEQVLPSRLRNRVNALHTYTVRVPPDSPGPTVELGTATGGTGVRSGSTASRRRSRPVPGSPRVVCLATISPPTCLAGCRPPRGGGGRESPCMRRPTS